MPGNQSAFASLITYVSICDFKRHHDRRVAISLWCVNKFLARMEFSNLMLHDAHLKAPLRMLHVFRAQLQFHAPCLDVLMLMDDGAIFSVTSLDTSAVEFFVPCGDSPEGQNLHHIIPSYPCTLVDVQFAVLRTQ